MLTVLFFARLREQLGQEKVSIELNNQTITISQLTERLIADHPQWQKYLTDRNVLVAINQSIACADDTVSASDEVAFFPPVTGG
ncbi:molybdopterin converting factor subunit 1 [Colwellia sp. MEBiC06753]